MKNYFTTALDPGTGLRTPRIPWRRTTPRPARTGRRRRASWSRGISATSTTIRRRMILTNTTTTSGRRRRPARSTTSTPTWTRSASLCSRRRIISSRAPRCRPRESARLVGDARAAPSRACRCSSSARRRRHPARAPPVSNPLCCPRR